MNKNLSFYRSSFFSDSFFSRFRCFLFRLGYRWRFFYWSLYFKFNRSDFYVRYFYSKDVIFRVFSSPRQIFYFFLICLSSIFQNFFGFLRTLFFLVAVLFSITFIFSLLSGFSEVFA